MGRKAKKKTTNAAPSGPPTALKAGVVGTGLVLLLLLAVRNGQGTEHPTPRGHDHAAQVVPAERYAEYARVQEVYQMVAAVPMIVDGLYCYCHCSEHSGHYSLLDCFKSDHGARCDVCMSEATIAFRMSSDGQDLDAIRAEIDARFGT